MPFLKPQSLHISLATARKRLSPGEPYWPCMRTLNISTAKPRQPPPRARVLPSATWSTERKREILTWTREYSVRRAGHSSRQRDLLKGELGKGRDEALRDPIRGEEQRVHARDADQRARHACAHPAST